MLDVDKMQPRCGFVENVNRLSRRSLAQFFGEFNSLSLATR